VRVRVRVCACMLVCLKP